MTRLRRTHVPGGLYYVILHSNQGRDAFTQPSDYESFIHLVARSVTRFNTQVHGFCFMPRTVHLAIEVSTAPLGRFVQQLAGLHARAMNRKRGQHSHLFEQRYWAVLLEQPSQLLDVVCHMHMAPLHARLTPHPDGYAWSSHHTYLGLAESAWVTTSRALGMLNTAEDLARTAYCDTIHQAVNKLIRPDCVCAVAPTTRERDGRFLAQLSSRRRRPFDPDLLNRILNSVAVKLSVSREAILSPSRRRCLTLARALVVWHATQNEVATVAEVAEWFDRNPSTLCAGLDRYRESRRDLFNQPIQELLNSAEGTISH